MVKISKPSCLSRGDTHTPLCKSDLHKAAISHYNAGYKELGKIDKDVYRIAETKIGIEQELLEKPAIEIE